MDRRVLFAVAVLIAPLCGCLQTGKSGPSVSASLPEREESSSTGNDNSKGGWLESITSSASVDGFVKGFGRIVTNITSPTSAEFTRLVERGDLRAADELFGKERSHFVAKFEAHKEVIDKLAGDLNARLTPKLLSVMSSVKAHRANIASEDQWPAIKESVADASAAIAEYREYFVLRERRYRSPHVAALSSEVEGLTDALRANAAAAFTKYDVAGKPSFFDAYPAELHAEHFTRANHAIIIERASQASYAQTLEISKKYPLPPEARAQLSKLHADKLADLADEARDFPAVHKLNEELRRLGRSPDDVNGLRVRVVDLTSADEPYRLSLKADVPYRPLTATRDELASRPKDVDYLIVFRGKSREPVRKVQDRKDVSSRYVSGYRTLPNPEYDQARLKYLEAQQDLATHELNSSRNPSASVAVAIMRGILSGRLRSQSQQFFQQYQSTPATIEEPIYSEYRFVTSTVLSEKSAQLELAILDYRNSMFHRIDVPWTDKKTFNIAFGIHKDDANGSIKSNYVSEDEIDSYEKAAHQVSLKDVLARAVDGSPKFLAYASIDDVFPASHEQRTKVAVAAVRGQPTGYEDPALTAKLDSVVIVLNPNGGMGTGFFVAPDLVVTNHHVIEGARFAELKFRNGSVTVGRLVKSDAGTDLALLKVADKGAPVSFHTSMVTVGSAVEVVGHPRGLEFSMTRGIVSAVRKMKNPLVPGSREMLVIQTDAPINKGNSGGPLYLNGKVVGVNTQKFSATGVEGLGFAVHYAEVVRFLQE